MIEDVGLHRPQRADIVGDRLQVRQALGNDLAALASGLELAVGAEVLGVLFQDGETVFRIERLRNNLAAKLLQLRLGIEQL
jgi:hypothetical protein